MELPRFQPVDIQEKNIFQSHPIISKHPNLQKVFKETIPKFCRPKFLTPFFGRLTIPNDSQPDPPTTRTGSEKHPKERTNSWTRKIHGFGEVALALNILLMAEILGSPVEVGSLSYYLQGFIHFRWLFGISAINSMFYISVCVHFFGSVTYQSSQGGLNSHGFVSSLKMWWRTQKTTQQDAVIRDFSYLHVHPSRKLMKIQCLSSWYLDFAQIHPQPPGFTDTKQDPFKKLCNSNGWI